MRIFFKVAQLTLVSLALFYMIHLFAKPKPKTMTKEWQEATNEYAKVRIYSCYGKPLRGSFLNSCVVKYLLTWFYNSVRKSTLSTVSAVRATRARASFRALLPRSKLGDKYLGGTGAAFRHAG